MESEILPQSLRISTVALIAPLTIFFFFFFFIIKKQNKAEAVSTELPPGPKKLPVVGNLHLISEPNFRCFRDLAKQYGPIMHLKLGEIDTIVVSSPEIAKQILKDNDPVYAYRPESIAIKIFWYNYKSITFCPYGDYWRQMRKICTVELLSPKNVRSFASIRKDEVARLLQSIRLSPGRPVNLTEKILSLMSSITCRAAFGKVCKDKQTLIRLVREDLEMGAGLSVADIFPSSTVASALSWGTKMKLLRMRRKLDVILDDIIREHETNPRGNGEFGNEDLVDVLLRSKNSGELQLPIDYNNIKAVIYDMFAGGTETSSSTVDWAIAELIRNPRVMAKAQAEVRQVMKQKMNNSNIDEEEDIKKLKYLKLVIMETHRLHPPFPMILRSSIDPHQINGYTLPNKQKLLVNIWAIQRDPKYWTNPETFEPERFQNQLSLDFTGSDFRYLPFGSGKRMCPGIAFGSASVVLPLAQLLYNFNWKLPHGMDAQAMNMIENSGIASSRKQNLFVVATPYA